MDEKNIRRSEEDENMFRRLVGASDKEDEAPEEIQARHERFEQGEPILWDVLAELPNEIDRRQQHYLGLYGLNDVYTEDEKELLEASFALMSDEQKKQYFRAIEAYWKRSFRTEDRDDHLNSLTSFAATNPPEVLRKHVWRLQRGLDEPFFGKEEAEEKPNRVREYKATVTVSLCDHCAKELEQETEEAGAERIISAKRFKKYFHDSSAMVGYYLFRYKEMYVEREKAAFFSDFPLRAPEECARCGTDEVTLWRERFGEKE
jgi:hypothetical protein